MRCSVCPLPQRAVKAAQNNIILRPVTCELTEELRRWFWKHFALHTWESVGASEDRTVNQPDARDVNGLSSPDRLRMIYHCFVFWCGDGDRTWNGNEVLKNLIQDQLHWINHVWYNTTLYSCELFLLIDCDSILTHIPNKADREEETFLAVSLSNCININCIYQ